MKASDIIATLEMLIAENGDLVVRAQTGDRDGSTWAEVDRIELGGDIKDGEFIDTFDLDTMW